MTPPSPGAMDAGVNHSGLIQRLARAGYAGIALFAGTIGVWAVYTPFTGAVIAPATVVVENSIRKLQHPTGGVVAEIRIREGERVTAGDVLVRLDETAARAALQIASRQLDEARARAVRLVAERNGLPSPRFPPELVERAGQNDIADLMASETHIQHARSAARAAAKDQLRKRIAQFQAEIGGLTLQLAARRREAVVNGRELNAVRGLFERNMAQLNRLTPLERDAAQIEGAIGVLTAQIAQSEGRISEIESQILQVDEDWRSEVLRELRDVEARVAELIERRIAADDQFRKLDIRAPVSGIVHQLAVNTVGGVLNPAELLMSLVPEGEALHLDARIAPADYDQLRLGQQVKVKLHAFDQRLGPELEGEVTRMAVDTSRDQQGASHYAIRVSLSPKALGQVAPGEIKAGMQADIFIQTTERTPASYLVRPLADQIARAFRER